MDPNECAKRILSAEDVDSRIQAVQDLRDWLRGGGFRPRAHLWRKVAPLLESLPTPGSLDGYGEDSAGSQVGSVPTVEAVARVLRLKRDALRSWGIAETEVRIRVHDYGWNLYTGDSSYDQDHRGFWGASSVSRRDRVRDLRDTASELVSQVMGAIHEAHSAEGARIDLPYVDDALEIGR